MRMGQLTAFDSVCPVSMMLYRMCSGLQARSLHSIPRVKVPRNQLHQNPEGEETVAAYSERVPERARTRWILHEYPENNRGEEELRPSLTKKKRQAGDRRFTGC